MATATVFRVEKDENFTTISNFHLKDKNLSLKAKGLLTLMLSLPEEWDMSERGLVSLSGDGRDSVRSALKELEQAGYLSRTRDRNSKGQLLCVHYTVYEKAVDSFDTTVPNSHSGKSDMDKNSHSGKSDMDKKSHSGKSDVDKNSHSGKSNVDKNSHSGKSNLGKTDLGKTDLGKTDLGKSATINNLHNKELNNKYIYNQSSSKDKKDREDTEDMMDRRTYAQMLINQREKYKAIIHENIEYELIASYGTPAQKDFYDLVTDVILDTVTSTEPTVRIRQQDFPTEVVRNQLLKVDAGTVDYVSDSIRNSSTKIHNMHSYILTALYSAQHGSDTYYAQWVKHDNKTYAG